MGKILTTEMLKNKNACIDGIEEFEQAAGGGWVELTEEWARENPDLDWAWFASLFLSPSTHIVYDNERRELMGLGSFAEYATARAALVVRLYNEE